MKILVTGFEPFGGETRNPSAEVVERLPDTVAGAEIIKLILPTVRYEAPRKVMQAVKEHCPDAVLSIGQAGGRAAVSVERVAVNLDDYRIPDNAGNQPADEPVVPGGPDAYLTNLPVKAMVEAIQRVGVPAQISLSAGTFVCNHVLYQVRHDLEERHPGVGNGFIHIPFLPEQVVDKPGQPSMSLDLSVRAVKAAICAIVEGNCPMTAGATEN